MTARIRSLTFDCAAPAQLAAFWAATLGVSVDDADDEGAIVEMADGSRLLFLRVPEGKSAKNRIHLDLRPDQPRLAEVARLAELGASVARHVEQPGDVFTVMLDPEGNEFCVEPSIDERARESG